MATDETIIVQLRRIIEIKGEKEFLSALRDVLSDPGFDLTKEAGAIDARALGTLYCLAIFINDIWVNLAIDASFEFPVNHPRLTGLTSELRNFIISSLGSNPEDGFASFCRAVKDYHTILQEMEEQLKRGHSTKGGQDDNCQA